MAVLDTQVMTEFSANLNSFNKAINGAKSEIDALLKTPGIESERITEELISLKTKLDSMSAKWDELSEKFHSELNISIEEGTQFQKAIEATLETN